MKLLVTGATGFIGSHFVEQAMTSGHAVVAIRRSEQSMPRVPWTGQPTWITGGLRQVTVADLEGVDCVVHLAAHSANVPYDTLESCLQENVMEPLSLFRTVVAAGISKFLIAGTGFEYGRSAMRYDSIPTNASLEPTQSYPASKAAATIAFSAFAEETQCRFRIARLFQVYGPGEHESRFWPSLKRAALAGEDFAMSEGNQVRDFIQVEEAARQLLALAQSSFSDASTFRILHVASGKPMSLRAFAEFWWNQWKATGKLRFGAIPMRTGEMMRFVPKMDDE